MNWYKKQLMKIAESCISNKSDDINLLSEMLSSEFNIHLSKSNIENALNKIAQQNKKNSSVVDDVMFSMSSSLADKDKMKLRDILIRYSQI
jgi:hypothetical protein